MSLINPWLTWKCLRVTGVLLAAATSCSEENPDFGDYNPGDPVADAGNGGEDSGDGNDEPDSGAGGGGGQADAGQPGGGDTGGDGDNGTPQPQPVRFVVLGDGGTGDANQKKVASAVKTVCAQRGCEFALYLGDNIYDNGVSSAQDTQFVSKFEEPYAELDFPFYVALGNHDYGSFGLNVWPEDARSTAQVEYTNYSDKWNMPSHYYTFRKGPVEFFVIDSNAVVTDLFRDADEQTEWLHQQMTASDAPWKIVMGHHPYISNGKHGNAGDYKGPIGFELHNGSTLRDLVEAEVCGKAQIFFSGHDHDREWLEPTCGTTFIVSGAAAKLDPIAGRGSPSRWSDGTKRGFLWAEIAGDTFTGIFYDDNAQIDYMDTVSR